MMMMIMIILLHSILPIFIKGKKKCYLVTVRERELEKMMESKFGLKICIYVCMNVCIYPFCLNAKRIEMLLMLID